MVKKNLLFENSFFLRKIRGLYIDTQLIYHHVRSTTYDITNDASFS